MTKLNASFFSLFVTCSLLCCGQSATNLAEIAYKNGVELSRKGGELGNKGNQKEASETIQQAILEFEKVLDLDSNHYNVLGSMGLCYFELNQFEEAKYWFNRSIQKNPNSTINQMFLGLCKIFLGDGMNGSAHLDRALSIDSSPELRSRVVDNLVELGELGLGFSKDLEDPKASKAYQRLGFSILTMAFTYSKKSPEVRQLIVDYSEKFDEPGIIEWLKK